MTDNDAHRPSDWPARQAALDPTRSLIVQAPAGSGKTELLTQRILVLLGQVERPEQLLAITFTRKAAREMRQRLLDALQDAERNEPLAGAHQQTTRLLASRVLEQDRRYAWKLLQNPSRLQILTIDSLCASLVGKMPWLSRFGSTPEITEDAEQLYRRAASRMVEKVHRNAPGSAEVATLLQHLDNRMDVLRDLLANMLGKRDQWLRHLLDQDRQAARSLLEEGLRSFIRAQLESVSQLMPADLAEGLSESLVFAAHNLLQQEGQRSLTWFVGQRTLPPADPDHLEDWQAIVEQLLTATGSPRRQVTVRQGFPAGREAPNPAMKQAFVAQLEVLAGHPELCSQLQRLRELPRPAYSESEWGLIEALVVLLPLTVVELDALFREQGTSDFIAVAAAARVALGSSDSPEDLLLKLDNRLQHILVDEFQDTSYGQYVLLHQLTSGWTADDGRTLFVVGDPMQSIYRFREAEVGLFLRARRFGLGTLQLEPLQLTANFRSSAELVAWFNRTFRGLFPEYEDEARGAVRFAAASAANPARGEPPLTVRCLAERDDQSEAAEVVRQVEQAWASVPDQTIGILVRSRSHAEPIVAALGAARLRYQAREIVLLKQRSIIQDLLALTRALLHPGDRVAWLSLLRAPWCGLSLDDLLVLFGDEPKLPVIEQLCQTELQQPLFSPLTPERLARLQQVTALLKTALARRGRVGLRRLVETTWLSLGGPACCEAVELADARQFFQLLDRLDQGGDLASFKDLDSALEGLYSAPDPLADERLQIMTIHKSKGLEFDTVIVPGLGRAVRGRDKALLRWLEHPDHELLLAPIPAADGHGEGATYLAIGKLLKDKEELEVIRLLYVAATRARHHLVLTGHLQPSASANGAPLAGSLLAAGWPALQDEFLAALDSVSQPPSALRPADNSSILRRLPADYRLPDWPESPDYVLQQTRFASRTPEELEFTATPARTSEARIVGETVHAWLEKQAGCSDPVLDERLSTALTSQLRARGIPQGRLEACLARTRQCILSAAAGERGRWLLQPHPEQAVELALAGLLDGQLVQAKIDRTFVDRKGVRWVIDYKTSAPGKDQPLEEFYRQQAERYTEQLVTYQRLMQHLEPGREIRMALYFPLIDGWQELSDG